MWHHVTPCDIVRHSAWTLWDTLRDHETSWDSLIHHETLWDTLLTTAKWVSKLWCQPASLNAAVIAVTSYILVVVVMVIIVCLQHLKFKKRACQRDRELQLEETKEQHYEPSWDTTSHHETLWAIMRSPQNAMKHHEAKWDITKKSWDAKKHGSSWLGSLHASWCLWLSSGISWHPKKSQDVSWCVTVSHAVFWCFMVFHGGSYAPWDITRHHKTQWEWDTIRHNHKTPCIRHHETLCLKHHEMPWTKMKHEENRRPHT